MQADVFEQTRASADKPDPAELEKLGALQAELASKAKALAEQAKQKDGQPAPEDQKPANQEPPQDVKPAGGAS